MGKNLENKEVQNQSFNVICMKDNLHRVALRFEETHLVFICWDCNREEKCLITMKESIVKKLTEEELQWLNKDIAITMWGGVIITSIFITVMWILIIRGVI